MDENINDSERDTTFTTAGFARMIERAAVYRTDGASPYAAPRPRLAVIVATGGTPAVLAATPATRSIPIIFTVGKPALAQF